MKALLPTVAVSICRVLRLIRIAATMGIFFVSFDSTAQQAQTIQVQGKDSSWKLVGSVDPLTAFQVGAEGNVDFGGFGQNDDPNAGVTGNEFAKFAKTIFSGGVSYLIEWLESVIASDVSSADNNVPESIHTSSDPSSYMHWNWVDYINTNGPTVDYDEGAFFVMLTTNDRPPTKNDSTNQVAAPALFYWYKKVFDQGANIAYDKKIWVWVKVHDGGRDPFSTSSFHDNHGSYTIWIDPDGKISDTSLSARVALSRFKFSNDPAATSLKVAAVGKMVGKPQHLATILKRRAPNIHPT